MVLKCRSSPEVRTERLAPSRSDTLRPANMTVEVKWYLVASPPTDKYRRPPSMIDLERTKDSVELSRLKALPFITTIAPCPSPLMLLVWILHACPKSRSVHEPFTEMPPRGFAAVPGLLCRISAVPPTELLLDAAQLTDRSPLLEAVAPAAECSEA